MNSSNLEINVRIFKEEENSEQSIHDFFYSNTNILGFKFYLTKIILEYWVYSQHFMFDPNKTLK